MTNPRAQDAESQIDNAAVRHLRLPDAAMTAIVVSLVIVVHGVFLLGNRGPVLYSDALGYLGNARFLAGGTPPTFDGSFAYSAGYSLLLVPIYWITERADVVWTIAIALNLVAAVAIVAPAAWIARRMFALRSTAALLVAAAVSLTPSLLLQPGRVWTETLFPLVFLCTVVALMWTIETGRILGAAATGAMAGYLLFIHGRGFAVVAALALVVSLAMLKRWMRPTAAVLAISVAVLVGVVDRLIRGLLSDQLWAPGARPANAGSISRILGSYAPSELIDTISTALGHTWYVLAASLGLAVVGVVALWERGRVSRWKARTPDAGAVGAVFILLAIAGVAVLSAGLLSDVNRVDHRIYGRYLEGVTPAIILSGSAWIVARTSGWRSWIAGGSAVIAAGMLLVAWRGPGDFEGGVQKFTIPALLGPQTIVDPPGGVFLAGIAVIAVSFLAGTIGLALAGVARKAGPAAVALFIAVSVGSTFVGKTTSWDPFTEFWYEGYASVAPAISALPSGVEVYYDLRFLDPDARNLYEFRLAPRKVVYVREPCDAGPGAVLVSTRDAGLLGVEATRLASDEIPDQSAWRIDEDACG
jgi:hypothetical protein